MKTRLVLLSSEASSKLMMETWLPNDTNEMDFNERLKMIKEENSKLLYKCEEDFQRTKEKDFTTSNSTPKQSTPTRSFLSNHNGSYSCGNLKNEPGYIKNEPGAERFEHFVKDYLKDMSSTKKSLNFEATEKDGRLNFFENSTDAVCISSNLSSLDRSLPDSATSDSGCDESEMEHYKEDTDINGHNNTRQCALARIEDMWEKFSVDDYAPWSGVDGKKPRLERSKSLNSKDKDKQEKTVINWRKKITVPEPFSMLVRDANKMPKKTKAMLELEKEREEKKRLEELECQRKFKASPVPQHVYQNLFDQIQEHEEARKRSSQANGAELLKATQKPFQFEEREERKKKDKLNNSMILPGERNKKKHLFKAHPFPARIFDKSVADKIEEEEEYRQIRIRIRAEEMMKSSCLPPSMKAKGLAYTDGKSRQKLFEERSKMAGLTSEHRFKPKVNDVIPDFEFCHQQLEEELAERKRQNLATVAVPFNLRSSKHSVKKHKIYDDIAEDAKTLRSNNWPFRRNPNTNPLSKSFSVSESLNSTLTEDLSKSAVNSPKRQKVGGKCKREKENKMRRKGKDTEKQVSDVESWNMKEQIQIDKDPYEDYQRKLEMLKREYEEKSAQLQARRSAFFDNNDIYSTSHSDSSDDENDRTFNISDENCESISPKERNDFWSKPASNQATLNIVKQSGSGQKYFPSEEHLSDVEQNMNWFAPQSFRPQKK